MSRGRRAKFILFLGVVLAMGSFAQNAIPLAEFLEDTNLRTQWDPYRQRGSIVRGSTSLSFSLDGGMVLQDYQIIHRVEGPFLEGSEVILPPEFVALARRLFPPEAATRRVTAIYIDPGHGGRDPGAIGRHAIDGERRQLQEKDVVLSVSLALAEMLRRRYPDKQIVMSRSEDVYLTLEERTRRANAIETAANEAVVFVSIHANASLNREANGFEVWYLPSEYRRDNLVSAEELGVEDPALLSILNTMREEEITIESVLLARNVLAGLDARIGDISPNRGLREESWYVVRNAKMPSILVEVGFVTERNEFLRLQNAPYLLELARGIYTGIENFVRNFEGLTVE